MGKELQVEGVVFMTKHGYLYLLAIGLSFVPFNVVNASSVDAFNKFITSSPEAGEIAAKVQQNEEITAACMSSATERHNGVTITRDGKIYSWYRDDNDTKGGQVKRLVKTDKAVADRIFKMRDTGDFLTSELDYKTDGTSYCYVNNTSGSKFKQITWPKNELMSGKKKVPEAARALFNAVVDAGAEAMGVKKK